MMNPAANGEPVSSHSATVDLRTIDPGAKLPEDDRKNLENMIVNLQKQLIEKTKTIRELSSNKLESCTPKTVPDDMQNMVTMLQKQLIEKTKTIREMSQSPVNNDTASTSKIGQLEGLISMLQKQLVDKNKEIQELQKAATPTFTRIPIEIDEPVVSSKSKFEPEIMVSAED